MFSLTTYLLNKRFLSKFCDFTFKLRSYNVTQIPCSIILEFTTICESGIRSYKVC